MPATCSGEDWDGECAGVIYALPNKGRYKDLNLQLQVGEGAAYSYIAGPEMRTTHITQQDTE